MRNDMRNLNEILINVDCVVKSEVDVADINIGGIVIDSRKVKPGDLFVCIEGLSFDGHDFIEQAVASGAAAVVCSNECLTAGASPRPTIVSVSNTRAAMNTISANFYGNPADSLVLTGVTGTNGKTSVTHFIQTLLDGALIAGEERLPGVIGTSGANVAGIDLGIEYLTSTTPDTPELHAIFTEMLKNGATDVVMEVSSHSLALNKVGGLLFEVGVFTNLTQDHLDFHQTMDNYRDAKAKLFHQCKTGIFNADDPASALIMSGAPCAELTYGIDSPCDFRAGNVRCTGAGTYFTLSINGTTEDFFIGIPGKFSVYNALAAICAAITLGLSTAQIKDGISRIKGVPGRFQSVPNNKNITIIVDYAHTPDALENIIKSVREFTTGKVITLFGCGGDRDSEKRPIMGRVAGELSDYCVLTSDNPRNEEPDEIIKEIELGILETNCKYVKIADRAEAVKAAVGMAAPGDSVVLAGKGAEDYQEFENGRRIKFNDADCAAGY